MSVDILSTIVCPALGVAICTVMWTAPLKDVLIARSRGNLKVLASNEVFHNKLFLRCDSIKTS